MRRELRMVRIRYYRVRQLTSVGEKRATTARNRLNAIIVFVKLVNLVGPTLVLHTMGNMPCRLGTTSSTATIQVLLRPDRTLSCEE